MAQPTEVSQLFEEPPICNRVEMVRIVEGLTNGAEDRVKIEA